MCEYLITIQGNDRGEKQGGNNETTHWMVLTEVIYSLKECTDNDTAAAPGMDFKKILLVVISIELS